MAQQVRVRYPPSPTGEPHVGNIRTAIFNWLFARHHGGAFLIRIEDTDQARKVEGAVEGQLAALSWLGIDWDEGPDIGGPYGPYVQSERLPLYRDAVDRLLGSGAAYRCYCSTERLAEMRKAQARRKVAGGYDRLCRDLTDEESSELERTNRRVGRTLQDASRRDHRRRPIMVRGEVTFENRLVDDFVMLKSDGFPTYHLANVVDDHLMEISHVMRAEEWLSSTPKHVRLYDALGWDRPAFAHLPIILAPDRAKLSKRHGATSVLDYRTRGYLPDAMVNFLTLLGWSLDDRTELFSKKALVSHFSIDRVGKAGAVFSTDKLDWMNGVYLREMEPDHLADALLDYWRRFPPEEFREIPDRAHLLRIVPLVQERIKTLADTAPLIAFFFRDVVEYETDDLVQRGMDLDRTREALGAALAALSGLDSFEAGPIEDALRAQAAELEVKAGQLFGTLRVATSGQRVAPPLFETLEVLGRERTLASVESGLERLKARIHS